MNRKEKTLFVSIICIAGECTHFVCNLFPDGTIRTILSLIFPCNETIWEHMKMFWYPFMVAGIILSMRKHEKGYFSGMVVAGIAAMLLQLGIFSFYESITGYSLIVLDIILFMTDVILCSMTGLLFAEQDWAKKYFIAFVFIAVAVTILIMFLTVNPGTGYIFMDDAGLRKLN